MPLEWEKNSSLAFVRCEVNWCIGQSGNWQVTGETGISNLTNQLINQYANFRNENCI